jgi:proton glutamate symport protein
MTKKKAGILSLLLFTIVAILHILHEYVTPISSAVLMWSRWIFIASLFIWGWFKKSLTTWIMIAMAMGIEIGVDFPAFSQNLQFLSKIFLRLIKTIVAPLLFSTLVVGIASHSNLKQVGRMGWKSILYFEVVTTLALIIGLIFINLTQAGVGIEVPKALLTELPNVVPKTWQDHIIDIFPENIIKSVYEGNVLPIVLFSVTRYIAGYAQRAKENRCEFAESLQKPCSGLPTSFCALWVGAIAVTVGHLGIDILKNLVILLLTLYVALIAFLLFVLLPIALYVAKIPIKKFIQAIREPVSIAFATTSSDSALPIALENMERFGVPRKIVSFVIPTGYTFNLDGTTLYLSLASVFVAQAANMHLDFWHQLLIGLSLMLTSKGVAAVPRASLVILIATASTFNFPLWPIMAIYGIDELMDMARTSVNVIGNTLASTVIARWEGEFDDEKAKNFTEV